MSIGPGIRKVVRLMSEQPVSEIPLDLFKTFVEEKVPFNKAMGLRVESMERGRVVVRLPFREDLVGDVFRPALHGGAIAASIDATAGAAAFTHVTMNDRMSTIDLRIDYLRPAPKRDLLVAAVVSRIGSRVAVVNVVVTVDGEDPEEPVAEGRAVFSVVRNYVAS